MRSLFKCAAVLVLLFLPSAALAQATLTGTVRDASGGGVDYAIEATGRAEAMLAAERV